jgi:hypothetical protein
LSQVLVEMGRKTDCARIRAQNVQEVKRERMDKVYARAFRSRAVGVNCHVAVLDGAEHLFQRAAGGGFTTASPAADFAELRNVNESTKKLVFEINFHPSVGSVNAFP